MNGITNMTESPYGYRNKIDTSQFNALKNARAQTAAAFGHKEFKGKSEASNNESGTKQQTSKRVSQMKQMLHTKQSKDKGENTVQSIIDQSMEYAKSLQMSRTKTKNTTNQVKKLKYSFKRISSRILRCKTSASAKQVVSAAKRATQDLKRQVRQGGYDEDEAQLAISHAKDMERVAKKKEKHLEIEEMAKRANGIGSEYDMTDTNWEENLDKDTVETENAQNDTMQNDYIQKDYVQNNSEEQIFSTSNLQTDFFGESMASGEDTISSMMQDVLKNLEEIGDLADLEELSEDLSDAFSGDLDPSDLKKMKNKHRQQEMKDIAKADAQYLKGMFDKYERDKGAMTPIPECSSSPVIPVCNEVRGIDITI